MRKWTPAEDAVLLAAWQAAPRNCASWQRELAPQLHRTPKACERRLWRILAQRGAPKRHLWTAKEDAAVLVALHDGAGWPGTRYADQVAYEFRRTRKAVQCRMARLRAATGILVGDVAPTPADFGGNYPRWRRQREAAKERCREIMVVLHPEVVERRKEFEAMMAQLQADLAPAKATQLTVHDVAPVRAPRELVPVKRKG